MMVSKLKIATAIGLIAAACVAIGLLGFSPMTNGQNILVQDPPPKNKDAKGEKKTDEQFDKMDAMFPDSRCHDFGKVAPGADCKHTFRVVNTTEYPITLLQLRISMSPITCRTTKTVIRPKEQAEIVTSLDARRFRGPSSWVLFLSTEQNGRHEEFRFLIRADSDESLLPKQGSK